MPDAEMWSISGVSWRNDWPAAMLAAATMFLIAPLWCVSVPALPDYPAHLASFWLIGGGESSFYRVHWVFAPNLASEILVPLLARLTGLEIAAKLFLSIAVALWVLGAGAVQRALTGRITIAPLVGALFAYNANFFWGFFNYYFAAGLSLAVFAAWISTAPGLRRTIAFTIAVTIVYFCHVFAAASLLVMLTGFEILGGLKSHDLSRRARDVFLIYLPSALAFALLMPHGSDMAVAFNLRDTMLDRFESLSLRHFDDPAYALPIVVGVLLLLALILRIARIVPQMILVLVVLLLATLLAPEEAMGGWGVHLRLPALFAILLAASTEVKLTWRLALPLGALALIMTGWTAANLAINWRGYDRQVAEFRAELASVPRGTRLFTVLDGNAIGEAPDPPYWHMAEWAIADRGAMTALMFTTKGQHVIRLIPPYDRFAAASADQGMPPDIGELDDLAAGQSANDPVIGDDLPYLMYFPRHYDEALVIHLDGQRSPVPAMLKLRHQGSFFALYNIMPPAR
jgi:hypothetical protein